MQHLDSSSSAGLLASQPAPGSTDGEDLRMKPIVRCKQFTHGGKMLPETFRRPDPDEMMP